MGFQQVRDVPLWDLILGYSHLGGNMGTNYYLPIEECPCCGHAKTQYHIGKASYGWPFAVQVYPSEGIHSLEDWFDRIKCVSQGGDGRCVINEYGDRLTLEELAKVINDTWDAHKFRATLDGRCIAHGKKCDLIIGDFS